MGGETDSSYVELAAGNGCRSAIKMTSESYPKSCPNCGLTGPCRYYVDAELDNPVPLHLGGAGTLVEALVWHAVVSKLPERRSEAWAPHSAMLDNAIAALLATRGALGADPDQVDAAARDVAALLLGQAGAPCKWES